MKNKLLIVGSGGHCLSCIKVIEEKINLRLLV